MIASSHIQIHTQRAGALKQPNHWGLRDVLLSSVFLSAHIKECSLYSGSQLVSATFWWLHFPLVSLLGFTHWTPVEAGGEIGKVDVHLAKSDKNAKMLFCRSTQRCFLFCFLSKSLCMLFAFVYSSHLFCFYITLITMLMQFQNTSTDFQMITRLNAHSLSVCFYLSSRQSHDCCMQHNQYSDNHSDM